MIIFILFFVGLIVIITLFIIWSVRDASQKRLSEMDHFSHDLKELIGGTIHDLQKFPIASQLKFEVEGRYKDRFVVGGIRQEGIRRGSHSSYLCYLKMMPKATLNLNWFRKHIFYPKIKKNLYLKKGWIVWRLSALTFVLSYEDTLSKNYITGILENLSNACETVEKSVNNVV